MVHARDAKGLKVQEERELALFIDKHFILDIDGLLIREVESRSTKCLLPAKRLGYNLFKLHEKSTQLRDQIYSWMNVDLE